MHAGEEKCSLEDLIWLSITGFLWAIVIALKVFAIFSANCCPQRGCIWGGLPRKFLGIIFFKVAKKVLNMVLSLFRALIVN